MKLERLTCCRDNILLCELGVLLHDLGKLSIEFNEICAAKSKRLFFAHEQILRRREAGSPPPDLPQLISPNDLSNIIEKLRETLETSSELPSCPLPTNERRDLTEQITEDAIAGISRVEYSNLNKNGKISLRDCCGEGFTPKDFLPDNFRKLFNGKRVCIPGLTPEPVSLGDFIDVKYLDKSAPELYKLFKLCDWNDSGIDKAYPSRESKQDGPTFFSSSSFGLEHLLDGDSIQSGRMELCGIIAEFVSDIFGESECLQQGALSISDWSERRRQLLTDVERLLGLAVAETRRSANDVSLWHHSYAVASLFKSSVAAQLLGGSIKNKWSILAVNFNVMSLIEKSHKIGDILGYVEFVQEKLCRAIKRVVEVVCPLGNEIYRDESGIYFTFPGLDKEMRNSVAKELKQLLFDEEPVRDFDLPISLSVSKPSAYIVEIGKKIDEGYQKAAFSTDDNIPDWVEHWKLCNEACDSGSAKLIRSFVYYDYECRSCEVSGCVFRSGDHIPRIDVCPVCQVRPKCTQQKICSSCSKRRVGRLGDWLKSEERAPTIWLSEVADSNRRLALISGQFGLWNWFSGTYVDSLFSQSLLKHRSTSQKFLESHGKYSKLIQEISDYVPGDNLANSSSLLSRMLASYIRGKAQGNFKTGDFFDQRNYRLSPEPSDTKYAHFLVCKPPSPSRLRRMWEETQQFWEKTVSSEIFQQHFYECGRPLKERLLLIPKNIMPEGIENHMLYEVNICGYVLSAVWLEEVSDNGAFLVVDNLSRIATRVGGFHKLPDFFSNECLEVSEGNIRVHIDAIVAERYSKYLPAVTLHTSPLSFMALVPAEDALGIIERIHDEYERQFGKVANRLSLAIGAIFFADKFPLYVAVDAARRMMDSFRTKQQKAKVANFHWEVICAQPACNGKYVELKLARVGDPEKHHHLTRKVSVELGDKNKIDVFYPYFVMITPDEVQLKEDDRDYFLWSDESGNWQPLVHVCHLKKGDVVSHLESHFDFEYLNSISAIGNLNYDSDGKRIVDTRFRGDRDWGLHQIDEIKDLFEMLTSNLTITQIRQLRETLMGTLNRWQLTPDSSCAEIAVYRKFARATLARLGDGNLWRNVTDESERTWLVESCVSGFIFDVLELYLDTLKQGAG